MTKQLSYCCKAEIKLTGKDRPEAFACVKCGRIIGTPLPETAQEKVERTKMLDMDEVYGNWKPEEVKMPITRYCTCCGRQMHPRKYIAYYDHKTGEPEYRWRYSCPFLFGIHGSEHLDEKSSVIIERYY